MKLKVATYNICHCGDYEGWEKGMDLPVNIEKTAQAIAALNADIVGLNEVYEFGEEERFRDQTKKLANLAGYKYCYFALGYKFEWATIGNAILSRYPILSVKEVAVPTIPKEKRAPDENAWYEDRVLLCADIDVNGKNLRVISTHFGLNKSEVVNIVREACTVIDEKESVVFMGDFNVTPQSELLAPIYARLHSAAKDMNNDEFTFASFAPKIHIDYIFLSKDIQTLGYEVEKCIVSDHRPITADIEF